MAPASDAPLVFVSRIKAPSLQSAERNPAVINCSTVDFRVKITHGGAGPERH